MPSTARAGRGPRVFDLLTLAAVFALAGAAVPSRAETPAELQARYARAARGENAAYTGPSAERGQRFFAATHGRDWSCASCHTSNPMQPGRHATTQKAIEPLAPAANANRFTRPEKVEKWFTRNCKDVLGRPCTAQEKADVMAYLNSLH